MVVVEDVRPQLRKDLAAASRRELEIVHELLALMLPLTSDKETLAEMFGDRCNEDHFCDLMDAAIASDRPPALAARDIVKAVLPQALSRQ